jgi:hypothetical protein
MTIFLCIWNFEPWHSTGSRSLYWGCLVVRFVSPCHRPSINSHSPQQIGTVHHSPIPMKDKHHLEGLASSIITDVDVLRVQLVNPSLCQFGPWCLAALGGRSGHYHRHSHQALSQHPRGNTSRSISGARKHRAVITRFIYLKIWEKMIIVALYAHFGI